MIVNHSGVQKRDESLGPIPSSGTEDGSNLRVGEKAHELIGSFSVLSGEVLMPAGEIGQGLEAKPPCLQDGNRLFQMLTPFFV